MSKRPEDVARTRVPRGFFRRIRAEGGLRREADMMGFTVSIALLAALMVGDDHAPHTRLDVLVIVWGTTLGLALAHWFALTLSVHLVRDPNLRYTPLEMLGAQMMMALLLAAVATVTVLALSVEYDRMGARISAALFIGVLAGAESRAGGASWRRALSWGLGALVVALGIATVKWLIGR